MASVMQGDAYNIPVTIKSGNGTLITPEIAACVEITVGQFTKRWPGQVTFDEKTGEWKFPVTQKQTFRFAPGAAVVQARVVFQDGSIMGGSGAPVRVEQSASHGTLPQPEKTEAVTGSAPKATEVTIPTVHDIDVSLHSQVILSDPIKAPYIGDNGNWYEYDAATGTFVDTGTPASGTPPITPDTAGKYLTNDGSKAEWGEVNGTLRVNLNKNSNGEWTIDKTLEEIQKAINDGQVVYVVDCHDISYSAGATNGVVFYYRGWFNTPVDDKLQFETFYNSNQVNYRRFLTISSGGVSVGDKTPSAGDVNAGFGNLLKLGDANSLDAATPNVDYALPTLYVTITQDGEDSDGNPIYKSDKTYAEIKAAHEAGREVKIARAGVFESVEFIALGMGDFSLSALDNDVAGFISIGIPMPFIPSSETGGQPTGFALISIDKSGHVNIDSNFDFSTEEWAPDAINKLPQQYLATVTMTAGGELSSTTTFDNLEKIYKAYQAFEDPTGIAALCVQVAFPNHAVSSIHRMTSYKNGMFVFQDIGTDGLSTITLTKNGDKDVWTHEVVPLGGGTDLSLGITGATVGQIAKITAVDTDGKPTKWGPVDMAGGGESPVVSSDWALLADITLAEDSAVIKIDKTSAGNSFSVRELAFFGGVKCDTVNKNLTLSVNGKIGYGNPILSLGQVLNAEASGTEYLAAYVNSLPECLFSRVQHNQYNTSMNYNAPSFAASYLRNEAVIAHQLIGNPITVFAIAPWADGKNGVFKAGTALKFYGR